MSSSDLIFYELLEQAKNDLETCYRFCDIIQYLDCIGKGKYNIFDTGSHIALFIDNNKMDVHEVVIETLKILSSCSFIDTLLYSIALKSINQ